MCPLRNATHKLKAYGTVLPTKHLSPKPRDMEPKQSRSPVNHPRTSFLRGSANGCSSDSTFSCGRSHGVQCVGARTRKKDAVCRNTDGASIIERCPGILQGFPGSSERSPPRLDLCEVSFARSAKANPAVHMGSSKHGLQRADSNAASHEGAAADAAPHEGAAADLRDTGTDSSYLASDKSYS